MAIQMTREEYEAQYGTQPVLNSSALDTAPAPIRMTRAEYNKIYRPETVQQPKQSITQETLEDYDQIGENVAPAIDQFKATQERIYNRVERGEISPLRGTFHKLSLGLNDGGNVLFQSGIGLAKTVLPQAAEDVIGRTVAGAVNLVTDYSKDFVGRKRESEDPRQRAVQSQIDETVQTYKDDETFRDDVNAAFGVLGAVFSAVGGPKAVRVAEKGVDTAKTAVRTGIDAAQTVKSKVDNARVTRVVDKRAEEIFNIETGYATTRRANDFSADEGAASRKRIASTDVLVDAVDEDGVIRTTRPGGAVEQYRAITVDGVEDIVRRNLERENVQISVQEVGNALRRAIADSNLEGADLVAALNGVKRELQGLSLRSDSLGQISLTKLHDAKISTTKNINYMTPPEQQAYRKAVASGYKRLVEDKSSFNVKEVNTELAKYYEDLERLKRLDGRRVKGGRLGKYFAQISGNIVGGAAGSVVGGQVGMALGTIAGGEAASFLKGKSMSRSFGKGGTRPVSNSVLDQAKAQAELPNQRPLNRPDPVVGAPKGAPKTKEIAKVEKQIRDNIKKQKTAIKEGNFTLVAALKEVYDALVDQLKKLVNEIKESAKNPSAGLSTRDVTRFLHEDDMAVMTRYINDARAVGEPLNAVEEALVDKLIERFGMSTEWSSNRIANQFEKILQGNKDFKGTVLPGMSKEASFPKVRKALGRD